METPASHGAAQVSGRRSSLHPLQRLEQFLEGLDALASVEVVERRLHILEEVAEVLLRSRQDSLGGLDEPPGGGHLAGTGAGEGSGDCVTHHLVPGLFIVPQMCSPD